MGTVRSVLRKSRRTLRRSFRKARTAILYVIVVAAGLAAFLFYVASSFEKHGGVTDRPGPKIRVERRR